MKAPRTAFRHCAHNVAQKHGKLPVRKKRSGLAHRCARPSRNLAM